MGMYRTVSETAWHNPQVAAVERARSHLESWSTRGSEAGRTSRFLAIFACVSLRAWRPRINAWILIAPSSSRACVSSRRSYRRSAAYTRWRGVLRGTSSPSATALADEKSPSWPPLPNEAYLMGERSTARGPADRSPASRWWKDCCNSANSASTALRLVARSRRASSA